MILRKVPKKSPQDEQESLLSRMSSRAKAYAEETTIHGFVYIAKEEHPIVSRLFWVIVVILALSFTTFQMLSLHQQWVENPVVTNLETISLPIEQIDFPAVTICPQGLVKDVMDNVLFRQLIEYIGNKEQTHKRYETWNVTHEEMLLHIDDFLRDVYPGAKDNPRKYLSLMTSDEPRKVVKNEAVLLGLQNQQCDERSNREIVKNFNKQLNHDYCPEGFVKLGNIGCILVAESQMNYI